MNLESVEKRMVCLDKDVTGEIGTLGTGFTGYQVTGRAFSLDPMGNWERLEVSGRAVTGLKSYISIGQTVEEVPSSYNSEKRWVQISEMNFEAGFTEIILYRCYGANG